MINLYLKKFKTGPSQESARPACYIGLEYAGGKKDGEQFVSPECVNYGELDSWLRGIEEKIKEIREEGRKYFQG